MLFRVVHFALVCFIFAGLVCDAHARKRLTPQERADTLTAKMNEKLSLVEGQIAEVMAINLETAQKIDSIRAEYAGKEMMEKIRACQKQRDRKLKDVLTEEQWRAYGHIKEELREKAAGRRAKRQQADENCRGGGEEEK